jgi:transcriptional regulator with AAA-type ATPase domain
MDPMPTKKQDVNATLSAPLDLLATRAGMALGITVLWHPQPKRIGEQAVIAFQHGVWELSRNAPDFYRSGREVGAALEYRGVSRQPLRFIERHDGSIGVTFPPGRMHCELDGQIIPDDGGEHHIVLDAGQLKRSVILRLGGNVLLCLGYVGIAPSSPQSNALIGVGAAITRVRSAIAQVADTDMPVLILGETGTGKELVAQAIHAASARSHRTMVSVNMAALGESLAAADLFGAAKGAYTGAHTARAGFFAEADGGTLFLDEIGDTPAAVQPMLLRALETGEYRPLGGVRTERADVRLVAATDRDLSAPSFNQPLLRRLDAFVIAMPPLRERREDLGVLIQHLLRRWGDADEPLPALPVSLVQTLCLYDWPGNVRQLSHVLRRLLLAASVGEWPDLGELLPATARDDPHSTKQDDAVSEPAVHYRSPAHIGEAEILAALEASQWRMSQAAEYLSVSRPSLYALIESCSAIRHAEAIPVSEIEAVIRAAPDDPSYWASRLRTPREGLRRRVRALGLSRVRSP